MRLVQVTIPAGRRNAVLRTLDELDVDYVMSDETSGREVTAVVSPTGVGAVFDGWGAKGVLRYVVEDVRAMIEAAIDGMSAYRSSGGNGS